MSYDLGDVAPLSVRITDKDGELADAGNVSLTVTLPDGTAEVTDPIVPTETGVYDHDFLTTQAGRHSVRWLATGLNSSAFTDTFDVSPESPTAFISLAEAKTFLHKDPTKTGDDEALMEFISAACTAIEDRVGPITPRTETYLSENHRIGTTCIILPRAPVISVVSVTALGEEIPEYDPDTGTSGWRLDAGSGLIKFVGSSWPYGSVSVVYRVGRVPIPANYQLAGKELTGHLWRSSQLNTSGGRPSLTGDDQIVVQGQAFALPNRVRELLGLGKLLTNNVWVG